MPHLTLDEAADVLRQLRDQLDDLDAETRAVIGLRIGDGNEVSLADVDISDAGILRVEDDVDGLIVVTGDTLGVAEEEHPQEVSQLVYLQPDGLEVGVFTVGDDPELYVWTTASDDDPNVEALRPRDRAANMARRALDLPSVVVDVPITELLARVWLLHVAQVTLELFDRDDSSGPVATADVAEAVEDGPFAGLLDAVEGDDTTTASRTLANELTWEDVRHLAAKGDLTIGPYAFDPDHAEWLDARGFAQYFDEIVMPTRELLGSLRTMGDDDLVGWALDQLLDRDWYAPTVGIATGDIAAAQQAASNDPRYGD